MFWISSVPGYTSVCRSCITRSSTVRMRFSYSFDSAFEFNLDIIESSKTSKIIYLCPRMLQLPQFRINFILINFSNFRIVVLNGYLPVESLYKPIYMINMILRTPANIIIKALYNSLYVANRLYFVVFFFNPLNILTAEFV